MVHHYMIHHYGGRFCGGPEVGNWSLDLDPGGFVPELVTCGAASIPPLDAYCRTVRDIQGTRVPNADLPVCSAPVYGAPFYSAPLNGAPLYIAHH